MKKFLLTAAVGTALLLNTMSANAACPCQQEDKMGPPMQPPGPEKMQKKWSPEKKAEMEKRKAEMEKRLGITEAQKAQLKAIHEKSKAQIAPKIKQLSEAEYELSVLEKREFNKAKYGISTLENVKLSGKNIDELRAEVKKLRGEIFEIKKANFEASQTVFTEKQKKELKKMHEERMKKHKNKMGKRAGRPMPQPLSQ